MRSAAGIVEELRRLLGLNSYEARAYMVLVVNGPLRPGEVAKRARIPPQRVYDVLHSLKAKGLVAEAQGEYYAIEPRAALMAKAEALLAEAAEKAEAIRRLGERLEAFASKTVAEYVKVVEGVEQSIGEALAILEACSETPVFTVLKVVDRLEELWPLLRLLLSKKPAKILVPCTARLPEKLVAEARGMGARIERAPCIPLDMLVACDTVVIGLPSRVSEVVAIVAKNPVLAAAMKKRVAEIEEEKCP